MNRKPPLWSARNQRERRDMEDWVNQHLDRIVDREIYDPTFMQKQHESANKIRFPKKSDYLFEIDEAERGNIEPLRRRFPLLAKYLHLPKRKRGQRFPKVPAVLERFGFNPVQAAVDDVRGNPLVLEGSIRKTEAA